MGPVRTEIRYWRWIWLGALLVVSGAYAASFGRVVWMADSNFSQVVHIVNGTATWHYATTSPLPGFGILAGAQVTPPADVFVWH